MQSPVPSDARTFARLLGPLAAAVFVGGWVLAVAAFFVIGTETCDEVSVALAGSIKACRDTTSDSVILLTVIGFAATVGAIFLLAIRHLLFALADIEQNTRKGG
ncbi:MAG TPA: hypothetical protein VMT90_00795 [Dehalococcoidia bacterium]|jgi:hypothetical protein|nr:hypothetical protein [Dehalococcoidia bacterium]